LLPLPEPDPAPDAELLPLLDAELPPDSDPELLPLPELAPLPDSELFPLLEPLDGPPSTDPELLPEPELLPLLLDPDSPPSVPPSCGLGTSPTP
jgi:hypothetical protein